MQSIKHANGDLSWFVRTALCLNLCTHALKLAPVKAAHMLPQAAAQPVQKLDLAACAHHQWLGECVVVTEGVPWQQVVVEGGR